MGKNSASPYFDTFVKMSDYACRSADMLQKSLESFRVDTLQEQITEMHVLEHGADVTKHEMMHHLAKEFLAPLEREDIDSLAQEMDEVVDYIEDVLRRIYMYNIQVIRPEALEFASVIVRCCAALQGAIGEFQNFRKSSTIIERIIEVNRLENEGDDLYTRAVRSLYVSCKDPIEVMAWTATYDCLEKCCDACEHVANVVEGVMMKNS